MAQYQAPLHNQLLILLNYLSGIKSNKKTGWLPCIIVLFCFVSFFANAQYQTFIHKGIERTYILHLPANLPKNAPLVVVLHAYTGTAMDMIQYSGLDAVADADLFAVCYPQGTKDKDGYTCWNMGYDFQKGMVADDLDFLDSLAVYLQGKYQLNPSNTFCTGHSNGGDMCYLIASHDAGIFKAVAAVSGCLMKWVKYASFKAPLIPVFEIHGTADSTTYWNGDLNNQQGYGAYYDIPTTFHYWAAKNKCKKEITDTLPDVNSTDGSIVISNKFIQGKHNNQVWLYTVLNGGHAWSGNPGTSMDISYSNEIWKFFKQFLK